MLLKNHFAILNHRDGKVENVAAQFQAELLTFLYDLTIDDGKAGLRLDCNRADDKGARRKV
jgi:hypothetical protein